MRTVIGSADTTKQTVFLHFNTPTTNTKSGMKNLDLNKLMQNVGAEQFDYETFKSAYDSDPRIKTMVKDFNQDGIEPMTAMNKSHRDPSKPDTGADPVSTMAKRATDVGAKL